jgi:hypothetical protein
MTSDLSRAVGLCPPCCYLCGATDAEHVGTTRQARPDAAEPSGQRSALPSFLVASG